MKINLAIIMLVAFYTAGAQDVLDYRYAQSGVRNQKARGTCTAFSICAALETFPGVPSNLSEQYLFSKAKFERLLNKDLENMDDGEFLEFYINILETEGIVTESKMPYDTSAVTFTNDRDVVTQFNDVTKGAKYYDMLSFQNVTYRVSKDQYVFYPSEEARNVDKIKMWLKAGIKAIPVSYPINSAAWSLATTQHNVIAPDSILAVVLNGDTLSYSTAKARDKNITEKILSEQVAVLPMWSNGLFDGGHAVTIVGYNNDGFIIKNSWGTSWGDKGYGVVSYDYHKMFCKKALILSEFNVNSNFHPKATDTYEPKDVCLKTFPVLTSNNDHTLSFSFLYDGDKPTPQFKSINIKLYSKSASTDVKTFIGQINTTINTASYNNGYYTYKPMLTNWSNREHTISAEVTFTLANGKTFTNTYPMLEWKNRTMHPGYLDALLFDDED